MTEPLRSADSIARTSRTDVFLGVVAPVGVRREVFEAKLKAALGAYGYDLRLWRLSELLETEKKLFADITPFQKTNPGDDGSTRSS